jgi:hypothetical protein
MNNYRQQCVYAMALYGGSIFYFCQRHVIYTNVGCHLFMNKVILLFLLTTLDCFGQDKDLDVDKHLWGQNRYIVDSFIKAGRKDFFFVDRMYPGQVFLQKYDSCKDDTFIKFLLVKSNNPNKYEFIKYDNCGQTRLTTNSQALQFFEKNRNQIKADSVDKRVLIDHTIFYSFYEFRDGGLKTYKHFCKACVDWDKDKSTKEKNQNLKMYKFFNKLDKELSKLIK